MLGSLSRAAVVVAALAAACGGGSGPEPCEREEQCDVGERCAVDGVVEVELEGGESGTCIPEGEAIGAAPATWDFRPGGRALADRLCMAQGLIPGASPEADAVRSRQVELLTGAGVRAIRLDLTWSAIEPSPGELDFSDYDPMIDAAVGAGLEVIGILDYGNPWASSQTEGDDKYPPDDPADFAAYARAVVEHYDGRIAAYEIWNEPNGGFRFFRPELNGDAGRYADLLVAAAAALGQACPDCAVYSAGLFYHTQIPNGAVEFAHDMLSARADAFDSVDAFGLHPYTLYPPIAAPEDDSDPERALGGMVADVGAVLALHAAPALPIAATEIGWPSIGDVDEATQARYLSREILLGAALGLDPLCWFTATDGPSHGSFPPEDDFGLYRYPSADPASPIDPKPARDAMAWLAQIGAGAVFAATAASPELHDPDAGRFALEFDSPSGRWTALWRLDSTPAAVHLDGETRSAVDMFGDPVASPAGGGLDIEVSDSPLFLVP